MATRTLKFLIGLLLLKVAGAEAFLSEPWLRMPYHMAGSLTYRYQFFDNVQNGVNPYGYHSHENLARANLLVPYAADGDIELEAEFNETAKNSFNFESVGLQLRRQILNDIAGDFVSIMLGGNVRYVTGLRLHDVVTPYHNLFNFELLGALGREVSRDGDWIARFFGFGAVGFANEGSPWIRVLLDARGKFHRSYVLRLFAEGYFGLGSQVIVNVDHFDSYAKIAHQSIDVGGSYTYIFQTQGSLSIQYAYRVFARSYPEHTNLFTFNYLFSF